MTIYQTMHRQVSRLNLSRYTWYKEFRRIPIFIASRKPVLVNGAFYMYADDYDSLDIMANRTYEPDGTKFFIQHLKEGTTALDIGANTGYYSLLFAQKCKKVYAFEPEKNNYKILEKNIKINNMADKIKAEKIAASDKAQELRLCIHRYNNGGHSIVNTIYNKYQEVNGIRLDEYFIDKEYPEYIKIDIEGYEPQAIGGAKETFRNAKYIIFEDSSGNAYNIIKELGFKISQLGNDGGNFCGVKE